MIIGTQSQSSVVVEVILVISTGALPNIGDLGRLKTIGILIIWGASYAGGLAVM